MDAEREYRAVLTLQEDTLPTDDAEILRTCSYLSDCLKSRDPKAALKMARRAFQGAVKTFDPEDSRTKKYGNQVESLEGELQR